MSLRTRLSLGLVVLAALGLALGGLVTYGALRSFLLDGVDEQLATDIGPLITRLDGPAGRFDRRPVPLPLGGYTERREATGELVESPIVYEGSALPDMPDDIPSGSFTVGATEGSTRFRVTARRLADGTVRVLALPLDDVDRTLHRLFLIELVVAGLVLGGIGVLGSLLVKRGLRPLEQMTDTAGAIAAGDLSQRVEHATDTTEVGRLGVALNTMLGQIEAAFAEREASESRLRRFVADASHELRTPLTSIRGYAELFRRGAAQRPDDLAKTMRRIEEEAARMGVLVDDLLLLARLDQGRPLERQPVDLARLATDAVDDARAAAPGRDITYAGNGVVSIVGDEVRLRQILANLLTNACTHTPPEAHVRCTVGTDNGEAVIEVSDDGPGMDADAALHAFERFWRGDPSRTRESGGAGLGLSIVAAIATAHGGRAEVDTAPGAGATFRVRLPSGVGVSAFSSES